MTKPHARRFWGSSSSIALRTFVAALSLGLAALAADARVPTLPVPSIRLDFGTPFVERLLAEAPLDLETLTIPRMEGVAWADALDASVWENAAEIGPLSRPEPETEFLAFYNRNGLFFRARNSFDPAHPPEGVLRERNNPSWTEDVFELRLRLPTTDMRGRPLGPDAPDASPLYHFAVTAPGTIYDARSESAGYDAEWESRSEIGDGVWTVWAMLPFSAIELDGPVPELEINIGRAGPKMAPLAWGPAWRSTANRRIILQGVPRHASPYVQADAPLSRADADTPPGREVSLEWIADRARPQDRWIEGAMSLPEETDGSQHTIAVSLWAPGGSEALDTVRAPVDRPTGRIHVDIRRWGLESARVVARLLRDGERIAVTESLVEAAPLPEAFPPGFRIPLVVNTPEGEATHDAWLLNAGVPFAPGEVWEPTGWRVEDADGTVYPTQLETSGRWALEGSIQWLRVDTVANPGADLSLVYRPDAAPAVPAQPLRVRRLAPDRVVVENGDFEYELAAKGSPIAEIRHNGRALVSEEGTRGLYVIDQLNRLATASADGAEVRVEAEGPVAASVRIEGDYRLAEGGEAIARHITRVEVSAGQPFARVTHTLVLTRDTNDVWLREVGWEMDLADDADREALFGTSRVDPEAHHRAALSGVEEAYLTQESYFRFASGDKRFRLAIPGEEEQSGEEMGDWFLAQNRSAGLLVSCRDSARQHPKEFNVQGNRINLKLFSPRAGEELDFRTETLVERWNLRDWAERSGRVGDIDGYIEEVKGMHSNALGWAKTHSILLSPAASPRAPGEAAAVSHWHSKPAFTMAAPEWIHRSRAMGPLHPRDTERFPEAEALIEGTVDYFASRSEDQGFWGFVDYHSGPRFSAGRMWRYALTYTLRGDAWRAFARSGQRTAYEFATGVNRSWGDNYLASWGGSDKTKGMLVNYIDLPLYWGSQTVTNHRSSTNLNQLLWDYHLNGYRRAGDQVRDYAEGIKSEWTPEKMARDRRVIMTFRTLLQCYGFTWDSDLEELVHATADVFEDEDGAVGLTKDRPLRSSTYKTRVDVRALLEARDLFAHPRYHRMARSLSEWLLHSFAGTEPVSYTNPLGIVGHFMYEETGNPMIAQALLAHLRWACADRDQDSMGMSCHLPTFILEGIPAIQDVVARTDADRKPVASWASARDYGEPLEFVFYKEDLEGMRVSLKTPADRGSSVGGPRMEAINPASQRGIESLRGFQQRTKMGNSLYSVWTAPVDAPEGPIKVASAQLELPGEHFAFAWGTPRMVLHAPGYWMPYPAQRPEVRWHFKVPDDARDPAMFFEGKARLYDPDGELWGESGGASEWVELPTDRPGLWSFAPLEAGVVRARNLPPFFSAERPEGYFDPGIEWSRDEEDVSKRMETPEESGFVQGVSGQPGDQALYISPGGAFAFDGGEPLGEGRGTEFLPFREGTIEFWMRPAWGAFTMPSDRQRVFRMHTDERPWDFTYERETHRYDHCFYAFAIGENPDGRRRSFRSYRGYTLFDPGEWMHIAVTWGPGARDNRGNPLTFVTYVNGRIGQQLHFAGTDGFVPADKPLRLEFPNLHAAIDHLRVSDTIRYREDFDPPERSTAPEIDERTKAYFSFDGTLAGVGGDGREIEGRLTP